MSELVKSDVEGLMYQQPGVLVSVDEEEYQNYIRRRKIMTDKDARIQHLEEGINNLNEKLAQVLTLIEGKK